MPNERKRDDRPDSRGPRRGDKRGKPADDSGLRRPPGPDLAGPAKWGRIARGGAGRMESPAIGTEAYDDFPAKRPRKPRPDTDNTDGDTTDAEKTDADKTDADKTDSGKRVAAEGGEAAPAADTVPVSATDAQPVVEKPPRPKRERDLPGAADLERHAARAVKRGRGPALRARRPLGARPQRVEDPAAVLKRLVGPDRVKSLTRKLNDAGRAFEAERFGDARALLRPVVKEAPTLADGRELMGLSLYRLGRWKEAIDQLEIFRELSDSTEQHPVLADCYRAMGKWDEVEFLWQELGEASPSSEIVTEGRIVLAGAHADQGDVAKAIRTLEAGWKAPKRPGDQHLRRAYALGDFYDRAGKTARAREMFKWVAGHDPHFSDVKTRVKQLS